MRPRARARTRTHNPERAVFVSFSDLIILRGVAATVAMAVAVTACFHRAELRAYQDAKATDVFRKALSGDVAKLDALQRRFEQETAIRKRTEADTAVATGRFKQVELEIRSAETQMRATAELAAALEKRRNDAINKRKADEVLY